jgi:hypothetical protein
MRESAFFAKFSVDDQVKRLGRTMTKSSLSWWAKQCDIVKVKSFKPSADDIIIDDGGHTMSQQQISLKTMMLQLNDGGIYVIEDLHTSYWPEYNGGLNKPNTFMEFTKECLDKLNARHTRGGIEEDYIAKQTISISVYDSIVCFEKGDLWWVESLNSSLLKYNKPA